MAAYKWLLLGALALLERCLAASDPALATQAHQLHIEEVQGIRVRSGRQLSQTFGGSSIVPLVLDESPCVSFNADDSAPLLDSEGIIVGYATVHSNGYDSSGQAIMRLDVAAILQGLTFANANLSTAGSSSSSGSNSTATGAGARNIRATISPDLPDACPSSAPARDLYTQGVAVACGKRRSTLDVSVPVSLFNCTAATTDDFTQVFFLQVEADMTKQACGAPTTPFYAGSVHNIISGGCTYIMVTAQCKPSTCGAAVDTSALAPGDLVTLALGATGRVPGGVTGRNAQRGNSKYYAQQGLSGVGAAVVGGVVGGLLLLASVLLGWVLFRRNGGVDRGGAAAARRLRRKGSVASDYLDAYRFGTDGDSFTFTVHDSGRLAKRKKGGKKGGKRGSGGGAAGEGQEGQQPCDADSSGVKAVALSDLSASKPSELLRAKAAGRWRDKFGSRTAGSPAGTPHGAGAMSGGGHSAQLVPTITEAEVEVDVDVEVDPALSGGAIEDAAAVAAGAAGATGAGAHTGPLDVASAGPVDAAAGAQASGNSVSSALYSIGGRPPSSIYAANGALFSPTGGAVARGPSVFAQSRGAMAAAAAGSAIAATPATPRAQMSISTPRRAALTVLRPTSTVPMVVGRGGAAAVAAVAPPGPGSPASPSADAAAAAAELAPPENAQSVFLNPLAMMGPSRRGRGGAATGASSDAEHDGSDASTAWDGGGATAAGRHMVTMADAAAAAHWAATPSIFSGGASGGGGGGSYSSRRRGSGGPSGSSRGGPGHTGNMPLMVLGEEPLIRQVLEEEGSPNATTHSSSARNLHAPAAADSPMAHGRAGSPLRWQSPDTVVSQNDGSGAGGAARSRSALSHIWSAALQQLTPRHLQQQAAQSPRLSTAPSRATAPPTAPIFGAPPSLPSLHMSSATFGAPRPGSTLVGRRPGGGSGGGGSGGGGPRPVAEGTLPLTPVVSGGGAESGATAFDAAYVAEVAAAAATAAAVAASALPPSPRETARLTAAARTLAPAAAAAPPPPPPQDAVPARRRALAPLVLPPALPALDAAAMAAAGGARGVRARSSRRLATSATSISTPSSSASAGVSQSSPRSTASGEDHF
ncbi:hypothetical protein HYH02_001216 [Chlamydomonas schloesseri]|uniref:Peptidase S1 domain-containing protein n=1 Tax=Chlamydomonas schloesseri TaxID=2026947 RepID=A0A835WV27_9CHLO|nr:hypothetical protein HYH02_001216 [Chlamydomonas schloesseri]|eukprot:KAG2454181.1 hypothetical protein HYH02_001216 [Chlamydomonas schloesseri]